MRIVADKNIPLAEEAFSLIGSVELFPGREIGSAAVKNADILLVRTVTGVNESLLRGGGVKFVGTATIGFDHVDTDYLKKNSIGFAYAPGSNANSVSEYILSGLLTLSKKQNLKLSDLTVGIIGCGNVGSKVLEKLEVLGVKTLLNDPPLFNKTGDKKYLPVEVLAEKADIITVHTPLTRSGNFPTFHLCGEGFFSALKKTPVYINSSRGAVCDSEALQDALARGKVSAAILDVWENEPGINMEILEKCAIATPHIAGYSLDGKVNATKMLFDAACRHFNLKERWEPIGMPLPDAPVIEIESSADEEKSIGEAVINAYNISEDDRKLRKISALPENERGGYFDSLRNNYPVRREFNSFTVKTPPDSRRCLDKFHKLGFKTGSEVEAPTKNRRNAVCPKSKT